MDLDDLDTATQSAQVLLQLYETARRRDPDSAGPQVQDDDFLDPLEFVAEHLGDKGVSGNEAIEVMAAAARELGTPMRPLEKEWNRIQYVHNNAGSPPATLPSSSAKTYNRLTLNKIPSTIRPRYPAFTLTLTARFDPLAEAVPESGSAPRRLSVLARAHDAWLPRPGASHDLQRFERELKRRRRTVNNVIAPQGAFPRPSWGRVGKRNACRGPLLDDKGDLRSDLFVSDVSRLDILIWLTFPVNPPGGSMIDHPTSSAAAPKLASTANKVIALQSLMPTTSRRMLWLDSVPAPRPAGERSNSSDKAQFEAFLATCRVVRTLGLRILIILQLANREWFESAMLPSHVRADLPPLDKSAFYCEAEELDQYWKWRHLDLDDDEGDANFRPATDLEKAIYVHHNVLPGCESTDGIGTLSIFVRHLFGGHNCRVFFGPHPCNMDPLAYPTTTFRSACDALERIAAAVESLLTRRPSTIRTETLQRMFDVPALRAVQLHSRAAGGTLAALRQLLTYEYSTRVQFQLHDLGPSLVELLEKWLLDDPTASIADYQPSAHASFPSLVGDLISKLASISLATLARIEGQLRDGTITQASSDARLLREAAASQNWQGRLSALGIDPTDRSAFRLAYAQNPIKRPSISQATRQTLALAQANSNGRLYWSLHFHGGSEANDAEAPALARGRIATLETGRSSARFTKGLVIPLTGPACAECMASGLSSCIYEYDQVGIDRTIIDFVPPDQVAAAVYSWHKVLSRHRGDPERADLLEQVERCVLEVEEWP